MNTMLKCSLILAVIVGVSACNDSDGKYDGKAQMNPDAEQSFSQLLTSVFVRGANAEPVVINGVNVTESFDAQAIADLSAAN
ncbi:MAG: hypothetical protein ACI8RU_001525 [Zhongshania aliphaticivorans]|jgi:hypothetical protein|uniref:hypothetical protein n=1 Tax=Zhongshania aliphaticivorans TaxID=1470434 RepID=UPI0039E5BF67